LDRFKTVLAVNDYRGEPTRVAVPVRAIIADALRLETAGLVLSHNHPSGDPTPSPHDIAATRTLARAAKSLGIRLHDHIVSGADRSVSFRAVGLL
jgi:DNA repair protein RadC